MCKIQNNKSNTFCVVLMSILQRMYAGYRDIFGMHCFFNGLPLMIAVQSRQLVFLLEFGQSNRDLLHTFVFNKFAVCDVIIPGRELEI